MIKTMIKLQNNNKIVKVTKYFQILKLGLDNVKL